IMLSPSGGWIVFSSLVSVDVSAQTATANRANRVHPGGMRDSSAEFAGQLQIIDIPSAQSIEWIQFPAPVTDFVICPSQAFIAVAHSQATSHLFPQGGLYVWANQAAFSSLEECVSSARKRPRLVAFPPIERESETTEDQINQLKDEPPKTGSSGLSLEIP